MMAKGKKEEESFYRGTQLGKQATPEWEMTNSLIFLKQKKITILGVHYKRSKSEKKMLT